MHDVVAGAGLKHGVSGLGPQQVGPIRHTLVENGRSVASSVGMAPPLPLQTIFWQSPGVDKDTGAVVGPG